MPAAVTAIRASPLRLGTGALLTSSSLPVNLIAFIWKLTGESEGNGYAAARGRAFDSHNHRPVPLDDSLQLLARAENRRHCSVSLHAPGKESRRQLVVLTVLLHEHGGAAVNKSRSGDPQRIAAVRTSGVFNRGNCGEAGS